MHPRSATLLVAALSTLLLGCPGKASSPPTGNTTTTTTETTDTTEPEVATGPTCETAADNAVVVVQRDGDIDGSNAGKLRAVVIELCTGDAWPAATLACMTSASDGDALEDCAESTLTPEQFERAGARVEAVMEGGSGPG